MMNLGGEMFEGDHDKCSVDDFLTNMPAGSGSNPCQEFCRPKYRNDRFKVFGYPGTSKFSASAGSLVDKIIHFLQSLDSIYFYGASSLLLQLWTPIRCSSGGVMLTVSEQPFAIQKLCKGLCRYRYSCIQQDIDVEGSLAGPIGKVFTQGYPAYYDSTSSSLSNCAFANPYGIGNDWRCLALPLFECDNAGNGQLQQCAGVLEVLSYRLDDYDFWAFWRVAVSLKSSGIECRRSDFVVCFNARLSVMESTLDTITLHYVRRKLDSPLIQTWLPCMCRTTSRPTHELVCTRSWASTYYDYQFACDFTTIFPHGSGWIQPPLDGRACSQNKACYIRDTSQLSISDYPLVNSTFVNLPKTCYVIQLKSIHPKLHPLVLEVFLPHLQICDQGNFPAQLKSLLSTVAQVLSQCNAAFGLQENEDFFVSNCHSDDDNVIFFEIHRNNKSMATNAATGHGTDDSGQNCGIHDAFVNRVTSSRESLRSCDNVFTMDDILIEEDKDAGEYLQIIEEIREHPSFDQEKQQFPPTTLEANEHSKFISDEDTAQASREVFANAETEIAMDAIPSGEEVEAAAETLASKLVRSCEMLQETAGDSKETFTVDVTLDMINQYRGHAKLDDVAKELKVSRATLKRRCRQYGIKRWPHYKRNAVHNIQSSAGLPKTELVEIGGSVIQESAIRQSSDNNESAVATLVPAIREGKGISPGNPKIDQGHPLIVQATCRDDIAKFNFYSNSGIEELRRELDKRFELEVGRFKIKYKGEDEDGDTEWINLSCNEDLIFCIKTLEASKKSTMILSVFPFAL